MHCACSPCMPCACAAAEPSQRRLWHLLNASRRTLLSYIACSHAALQHRCTCFSAACGTRCFHNSMDCTSALPSTITLHPLLHAAFSCSTRVCCRHAVRTSRCILQGAAGCHRHPANAFAHARPGQHMQRYKAASSQNAVSLCSNLRRGAGAAAGAAHEQSAARASVQGALTRPAHHPCSGRLAGTSCSCLTQRCIHVQPNCLGLVRCRVPLT